MRGVIVAAVLGLAAGEARAGNDDTYFMSDDAALMAGAVVATTGGAGSVWYNPAGLGSVTRDQLDLSLSAAAYQRRFVADGLVTELPGETVREDLDGSRGVIVSPSLGYVRRLGAVTIGAGLFTARDDVILLQGSARGENALHASDTDVERIAYHLGVSTGLRITDTLRVGASVFVVYDSTDAKLGLTLAAEDETTDPPSLVALTLVGRERSDRWGMRADVGVQWDAHPKLTVGVAVRSPVLLLTESLDSAQLLQLAVNGPDVDPPVDQVDANPIRTAAPVGMLEPARVFAGLAIRAGDGVIAVGGDYTLPLESLDTRLEGAAEPNYFVDRDGVWNLRAGTLFPVTATVELGGGVFTDRSAQKRPEFFDEFRVDYYGATAGVRLTTPVELASSERIDTLHFRTSISLRYALGIGDTAITAFDLSSPSQFDIISGELKDVRFHEAYLFIGSSLLF